MIERAGIEVHLHDELFRGDTDDPAWLAKLGQSGWLLVSGDNDMTRTPLFLHQLAASKAHVFVLLGLNGASADGKAEWIVKTYDRMCALAAETTPPAIWRIGKTPSISAAHSNGRHEDGEAGPSPGAGGQTKPEQLIQSWVMKTISESNGVSNRRLPRKTEPVALLICSGGR